MPLAVRIYSTNIHLPDKADYNKIILGFIDYDGVNQWFKIDNNVTVSVTLLSVFYPNYE